MADPGTPDWWLDRLYVKLRNRQPHIDSANNWYTGQHPVPRGHEDAEPMFARIMETVGLNMLAIVTNAGLGRQRVRGFHLDGKPLDAAWDHFESNRFALASKQVLQESRALAYSYVLVDPKENRYGFPTWTPEHPSQCIVEHAGGSQERVAGAKVWQDDSTGMPLLHAVVYLPDRVLKYSAPTRIFANPTRSGLALRPRWEFQESESGTNPIGEVPLVPFENRPRMVDGPVPEFNPAIPIQRRINKSLLDRMALQDQGSFKAMWATGLKIPRDPATGQPVESVIKAINKVFVNENPEGKFGQLQADDIKQILDAVRDDVADAAVAVPTSPDQIMGKLVNVSGDGLKLAQISEVGRVRHQAAYDGESFAEVARISLRAADTEPARAFAIATDWANFEYRTDAEASDAASKALANGVPHEVVWTRYYDATADDVADWREKYDAQQDRDAAAADPVGRALLRDAGVVGSDASA